MQFGLMELELKNFCQFREFFAVFRPGLIGIYGPNGAGKSNAVNVGAYAALTNDYSRHSLTADITRNLRPDSHRLEIPGERPKTSAGSIQTALEETLGISRALLDEYVFIGQGEMAAFISPRMAERTKSFARLCGTDHAEVCWNLIGDMLTPDRTLAAQVVDNSDDLRKELVKYRKRVEIAKKRLRHARKKLLTPTEKEAFERILGDYEQAKQLQEHIATYTKEEAELKTLAVSAKKAADAAEEKLTTRKAELKAAQQDLKEYQAAIATYEERRKNLRRRTQLEEELKDLQGKKWPKLVKPCEDTVDELLQAVADSTSEKNRCEQLLEDTEGVTTTCPLCGERTDKLVKRIQAARNALPSLEQQVKDGNKLLRDLRAYDCDKLNQDRKKGLDAVRIEQIQKDLLPLKDVRLFTAKEKDEAAAAAKLEAQVTELEEQLDVLEPQAKTALRAKERRIADHKAKKTQLETAEQTLATLHITAKEAEEVTTKLDANRDVELAVERHRAHYRNFRETVKQARAGLSKLKTTMGRSRRAHKWVKLNDRAREILHRDNLPAKVHQAKLEEMEDAINADLKDFRSPFRIMAEEGLNLVANFRNGTSMPAAGGFPLNGSAKSGRLTCGVPR